MNYRRVFSIIILLLLLFVFLFRQPSEYGKIDAFVCILSVLIVSSVFLRAQQSTEFRGFWIKPSNILLLSLWIVNFQYIIDYLIGYKSLNDFYIPGIVIRSTYISALGIISFIITCIPDNTSRIVFDHSEDESGVCNYYNNRNINCTFLIILQILFFILWIVNVNLGSLLSGLKYGVSGGIADIFEDLFYQSTISVLVCLTINAKREGITSFIDYIKQNSVFSWIVILCYLLLRLISGDRGPSIYTFLAVFFSYVIASKKRIKLVFVVIALLFGAVIISIVGMARNNIESGSFKDRISIAYSNYTTSENARFSDRTIINSTEELATSLRCNLIAVNEVENCSAPLHYGKYQLYRLLSCIPFMPSFLAKRGLSPSEFSSDYYLTDIFFGDFYISGQIGTTCIADFFLDFGVLGVILGMLILGLVFNRVDRAVCISELLSPIIVIITILFACQSYYIPRSTVISQMKPFIPVCVFYYLNYLLTKR